MITETKTIRSCVSGKEYFGCITLGKLAVPESMTVTVLGKKIIPSSFDIYGHPKFTEEQEALYRFKREEINRKKGEYLPLEAIVTYEERPFDIPRESFDSLYGISESISSLEKLNNMLTNRKLFRMANKNEYLGKFIIFGRFYLDQFAQIWSLNAKDIDDSIGISDVEYMDVFVKKLPSFTLSSNSFAIPKPNSICPCCGKMITIEDIKTNPCELINGKYYHSSCFKNFRRLIEVDKLTRCLMDLIYDYKDYTFDLIPNGYCNQDCCDYIPWIKFHTPDGDIIMGWRKRVISIEWQENYKLFDMDKLFGKENVTKWVNGKKRGIHAWGDGKAIEYLEKVQKTVNPKYSKYAVN